MQKTASDTPSDKLSDTLGDKLGSPDWNEDSQAACCRWFALKNSAVWLHAAVIQQRSNDARDCVHGASLLLCVRTSNKESAPCRRMNVLPDPRYSERKKVEGEREKKTRRRV